MWGQGKRDGAPRSTWWNVMIPMRRRVSAPDAVGDYLGPSSSYVERQVADRLRDPQWADQAHVPPLVVRGTPAVPSHLLQP